MRAITLSLAFILLATPLMAETYVLVETATNQVKMISHKDDIVNNTEGYEVKVLDKDLSHYGLDDSYENYKLIDKKFIVNVDKITAEEEKKKADKQKEEKNKTLKADVINKLIDLGFKQDEAEYLTR